MSFVTKAPPGKDQPHGQIPPLPPVLTDPPQSSTLPTFMAAAAAAQATSNPQWNYNSLQAQATSLYVQQVAQGQSWSKASFQSITHRANLNEPTQALQSPPSTTPSVTISKVPAVVSPPTQPPVQPQTLAANNSSPPKPAEVPQQVPMVQPLQTNLPQQSNVGNNIVPQKTITTPPKVSETAPPPLKKTPSPVTLPPVPVTHQKQHTIVQKTPTKSTLRLATVTPRIKTTPKKSPPLLAPKSPVPTDRPNALIKQKDLSPPQTAPVVKPAQPDAPNVPSKTPSPEAALKESPPPPLPKETPKVTPKETDEKQITREAKESPKASPPKPVSAQNTKSESKSSEKKPIEKPIEKNEKPLKEPKVENEVKQKPHKEKEVKVTKEPKPEAKPEAKEKEAPKRAPKTPKTPAISAAESEQRAKRMRKEVQPFQSPIPEIENVKKLSIATLSPSNKNSEEKLILFYKNEFLAVRNAEGSFYLCQANHNVTKKGQKIKIRWLNQEKPSSRIYVPDYYDQTDFECVLTTVELEKSGKTNYKISEKEQKRVEHILKNALDVEKGIAPKPEITEENPDGLDLSIYTSESQLDRSASVSTKTPTSSKKSAKVSKRQRESLDDDSDEDFTPLSKVAKTKTSQKSASTPAASANGRGRNRKASVETTPAPSTKKALTRGKKDDGDPLGVADKSVQIADSSKTKKTVKKSNAKEPISTRTTRTRK